jgi:hypothetical protein
MIFAKDELNSLTGFIQVKKYYELRLNDWKIE